VFILSPGRFTDAVIGQQNGEVAFSGILFLNKLLTSSPRMMPSSGASASSPDARQQDCPDDPMKAAVQSPLDALQKSAAATEPATYTLPEFLKVAN
jgi:hypothetical protein